MEDQLIKFEMLSEPVITFETDTGGQSIPMATAIILVKATQGIPCSRVIKVLFDSEGSASIINKKISSIRVQITMI